jgi:uncharacterized protein (TIGR00297 family)
MRLFTLNKLGILAAVVLAALLFLIGMQSYYGVGRGMPGPQEGLRPAGPPPPLGGARNMLGISSVVGLMYVLAMLLFLVLAAVSTGYGKAQKIRLGVYESSRGVRNVVANGVGPLAFAIIVMVLGLFNLWLLYLGAVVGFLACVAAITADKFSSEFGVLDGPPVMIFTGKRVRRGVSGGITLFGLVAGLAGAIIASILLPLFFVMLGIPFFWFGVVAVVIGGVVGMVADSMLGFYETKGIGTKHSSNFIASIIGGFWGMALFMLFIIMLH